MHKSRGKLSGVLHKGFKPDKCKTSLRMAVARIKLLRNRKEVAVRQMRREVAQLLEANQDQTARIRVEHVIREEKFMQAYDLIEVYCELIVARLSIIDSQKICPIDLKEAVASVIFASMRCADVTELADVRKHFTSKYGKEFAAAALEVRPNSGVNRLVIEKLSAGAPDIQTKIKTLTSIAEEHNIKWEPKAFEEKLQKQNEDLLHGPTAHYGGNISTMGSSTPSISTPHPPYSSVSAAAVDSVASNVPVGPYSPAGVSANNTSLEGNRRGSKAPAPLSSQYSASTYYSAQIPGPNNFLHENPGGQSVSRPYSHYDAPAPDSVSRDEEINQPRERKPSVSGANWNMEFKDATSAAQAAAESAEMASIAARAAAQLASRGNYSGKHGTGGFESEAYNHQNSPMKQTASPSAKDEKRSFNDQSSHTNVSRMTSSNEGKHSASAETNRLDTQNMSTDYSPSQDVHSYNSGSHAYVYGMPVEPLHAHSPVSPHFDDLYDRESNIGRHDHPMDIHEEKFQDTALSEHNVSDAHANQVSSDHESKDDYYGNYSSSHGTFTHGSRTVWDNQTDNTQVNPSSAVFDQYDSDVKEENLFDTFTSKHTEQLPGVYDNVESSNTDWSQQHRNDSPSNHRTSDLFSRTETQKSDTLEANRRDIPSPRSYDNLPPTFDSDGGSSDEEIAPRPTTMHAETLRSHSKGSTNSGKLVRDVNESIEDYYESSSGKKSVTSPGLNLSYKGQLESGHSPRYDYSQAQMQRNISHVQSRDSDISDEESELEPDKLKVASSLRANENQSSPFAQRTSATFDDSDEGDFGLNFRLTPGLRNKPKQPSPYPKSSREAVLPRQSLNKASASIEEPVDSEENTTFKPIRSTTKSSRSSNTSSGGGYSSELYNKNPSVETPKIARSTMARNSLLSDDTENLSEQFGNASLVETKGSEPRNCAQEFYHDKTDVGGRRQMRPRMTKNFFDLDDSDEEIEQRQVRQSKWSSEQILSRRTLEVTSGAKRDGLVQTRAQYADESESMPKEAEVTRAFSNSNVEQRRDRPDARVPVQRPSTKTEHNESPIARGKLQKAEVDTRSVPANENTETSAGTPKESTSKTAPAHVHPKLPTDYDSFAAHFKSLRTNRR